MDREYDPGQECQQAIIKKQQNQVKNQTDIYKMQKDIGQMESKRAPVPEVVIHKMKEHKDRPVKSRNLFVLKDHRNDRGKNVVKILENGRLVSDQKDIIVNKAVAEGIPKNQQGDRQQNRQGDPV
jgi:hypothetical protein